MFPSADVFYNADRTYINTLVNTGEHYAGTITMATSGNIAFTFVQDYISGLDGIPLGAHRSFSRRCFSTSKDSLILWRVSRL